VKRQQTQQSGVMLWIPRFVRISRPFHIAATQLEGGVDALRAYAGLGNVIAMKYGVLQYPGTLDAPAWETLPQLLEFVGRHVCDVLPSLDQIDNRVTPPNLLMPQIAKILPCKTVKTPSGRKAYQAINALLSG
jgi:hypothetical protein